MLPDVLPMPIIQRGIETQHVLFLSDKMLRVLAARESWVSTKWSGVSKLQVWEKGNNFRIPGPEKGPSVSALCSPSV